jgi:AraC-like DNA-binding protein
MTQIKQNWVSKEYIRKWMDSQSEDELFNKMLGGGSSIYITAEQLQRSRVPPVSEYAKENLLYTQSIGLRYSAMPGFFIERQGLESYLILFTLGGEGLLKYLNREYRLTAGDCILIDCRQTHYYATTSNQNWTHHILHLNGKGIEFYYNEYMNSDSAVVKVDNDSQIEDTLQKLLRICNHYSSNEWTQHKLLAGLLVDLVLNTEIHQKDKVSSETAKICAYIEQHYTEAVTLDLLSKKFFRNKYSISRTFKAELGMGVNKYLNSVRLNAAKELLCTTNQTIEEISLAVGFTYPHYFIGVFKRETGQTPTQFRNHF